MGDRRNDTISHSMIRDCKIHLWIVFLVNNISILKVNKCDFSNHSSRVQECLKDGIKPSISTVIMSTSQVLQRTNNSN